MYIKLNEDERAMLNKVQEATWTNYEIEGNYIKADNLIVALEDLMTAYEGLKEERDDLKRDLEENYKPIDDDPYEFYGVSRNDF